MPFAKAPRPPQMVYELNARLQMPICIEIQFIDCSNWEFYRCAHHQVAGKRLFLENLASQL